MQKYVAAPGREVRGTEIVRLETAVNLDYYPNASPPVTDVFLQHGVEEFEEDGWYPQQLLLDLFKRYASRQNDPDEALFNLSSRYPDTLSYPPDEETMLAGLQTWCDTYRHHVRGGPDEAGFAVSQPGERHIRLTDRSPIPHPFVNGLIQSIAFRFRPDPTSLPTFERVFLNADDPDADGAIYNITW